MLSSTVMLPRIRHCRCWDPTLRFIALQRCALSTASKQNLGPNDGILEVLEQNMQEEAAKSERNPYKIRAFSTAIKAVKQLERPIVSVEEVRLLRGVGPGIARRIQDYLDVHSPVNPPSISNSKATRKLTLCLRSSQTEGGPHVNKRSGKAQTLIDAGCTSLNDLKLPQYRSKLSNAQLVGIDFHDHLQESAQRREAEVVAQLIQDSVSSKFDVHLVGGYRRGAPTSSSIDIMILHPSHVHIPTPAPFTPASKKQHRSQFVFHTTPPTKSSRANSPLLTHVVPSLQDRGLVAVALSSGPQTWQGIALVPDGENGGREDRQKRLQMIGKKEGIYRRLNISMVPIKSRGAALLALTGDAEFNRHLCTRATKLGLHLNEYGLWRWHHEASTGCDMDPFDPEQPDSQSIRGHWELIKAESEEDILLELGLDYVAPERRNYEFLVNTPGKKKRGKKLSS
ncbi:Nucleotidyltransferase [Pleurotus eryngii]|uniref:DNA polymerase n=1 Tax=Pleurotus eryngii TaxID=5323 RepID=A0A9P5ZRW7_PLEER|nr:Nucleotidyltransferase [Pleurotus eryngii]